MKRFRYGRHIILLTMSLGMVVGCHTDMWVQPRDKALMKSEFFEDGMASRPPVEGTVAQGHLNEDRVFFTGVKDGKWTDEFPIEVTRAVLERGQERFDVYCSPCHGRMGDGKGMIAQRGLDLRRQPASYHDERLQEMPVGYFYDVITNGYGVMYSYASRVQPQDRWAIVAYIRALQLSQDAPAEDLTQEDWDWINGVHEEAEEGNAEH